MALLCEACGQFQKSCDAPAGVCISPPASPCLSDSPRSSAWTSGSPSWGSHGRQPPCPGHGGFTTSFLTPEHSSKIAAPLKEKPTHPTVSELLQQEPPPTPPTPPNSPCRGSPVESVLEDFPPYFSGSPQLGLCARSPLAGPGIWVPAFSSPFSISEGPGPSVCRFLGRLWQITVDTGT